MTLSLNIKFAHYTLYWKGINPHSNCRPWCHVILHPVDTQPVKCRVDLLRNRCYLYRNKSEITFAYFLICMSTTLYCIHLVALGEYLRKVCVS
ncbi:hypothetical protein K450DRAFT_252234 [Umbelopsis ramanniana AG]|uniref:Uncharacterized protein n=1 Tax=Umbelopsis ramanniana AG TaxID=1314678 RepID=A0AAD5HAS8_UMBRA|nr:uncharacterized protein K450DRAFT_252234 [Umbelopsis ramanniana AG]KAI8577395.1 hypothetical protein K450DRAFT_252234 [Umbelopsis ramanniana AG]